MFRFFYFHINLKYLSLYIQKILNFKQFFNNTFFRSCFARKFAKMGDKDLPFFVQSNFLLGFPFYCNPSFIKKKVNVNELDANKWLEVIPNK